MDLFQEIEVQAKTLSDHILSGDVKSTLDAMRAMSQTDIATQVARCGLSMISFKHGLPEVMSHVVRQMQN